jgi:hypothetical protein
VKYRHGLIAILVGVAMFVIGGAVLYSGISDSRDAPEVSPLQVVVTPHSETIIEIEAINARYEYHMISLSGFDFALILTQADLERYRAGEQITFGDQAAAVGHWDTFIQTGAGNSFALLFSNSQGREITVEGTQTLFHNPPAAIMFGSIGSILGGLALAGAGIILLIVRAIRGSSTNGSHSSEQAWQRR